MICLKCNGERWLRIEVTIPAHVYGETRTGYIVKVCPVCRGTGRVKIKLPDDITIS